MARKLSFKALSRLKIKRVNTLRREGFTDPEINIYMDRRMSSRGMLKIRRERARELRDLTPAQKEEWAAQNIEGYTEQDAADALARVSPEGE